jgi:hypothetical protein
LADDDETGSSISISDASSCSERASVADVAADTTTDGEIDGRNSLSGVGVLDRDGGGHELRLLLELDSLFSFALSFCRSTEHGLTFLPLPPLRTERTDDEDDRAAASL